MRRIPHSLSAAFLLALVALVLAGCASLNGARTLTFTDADMTRLLEQHEPFQRRLLDVLDVRINRPAVRLLPESSRLATDFDLVTTERVSDKTYSGRLSIDYGVRYDDALQAIRMTRVRVNQLHIDKLPSPQQAGLHRLGTRIAEELLEGAVIYRFKPADLKNAEGRGLKPSAVAVNAKGVQVTLTPVGR